MALHNEEHKKKLIEEGKYKEYENIFCPYCFNKGNGPMSHTDVQFRSNTYFKEDDLDSMEVQYGSQEYKKYHSFISGEDPIYNQFWNDYGKRTEIEPKGMALGDVVPWERPIISDNRISRLLTDSQGFVEGCVDVFGKESYNRVCPYCHNPLPTQFGKYPVENISIIGINGAGKTVYLAQLLKYMGKYAANIGMSCVKTSSRVNEFIANNDPNNYDTSNKTRTVVQSTVSGKLSQPLCYLLTNNKSVKKMIVLYDIAGEDCKTPEQLQKFAPFIKRSSGILILIPPAQLGFLDGSDNKNDYEALDAHTAINSITNILPQNNEGKCEIPIALCISKADKLVYGKDNILPQDTIVLQDVSMYKKGEPIFNGNEYASVHKVVKSILEDNILDVTTTLKNNYEKSNYFAFSSIKCGVDEDTKVPISEAFPVRIEEPIYWLFKQFGYIRTYGSIPIPNPYEETITRRCGFMGRRTESKTIEIKTEEDVIKWNHSRTLDEGERWRLYEDK